MGDRTEDDIETRIITRVNWILPVKRPEDLPTEGVPEGAMCYVEGESEDDEEVWEYRNGLWGRLG